MANQGKSLDEISSATGLSNEEIEPIFEISRQTLVYIVLMFSLNS